MINFSIIGFGYWGPRVLKNIERNKYCKNIAICDIKKNIQINDNYIFYNDYRELIINNKIDVVVISTPLKTHYKIAKFALENDKHVWIEKPFVSKSSEAEKLINLAKKKNKILFIDHPYIYSEAIKKIKKIISKKSSFGNLYLYDSTRVNLGRFRGDTNVFWDLAVHDLSIIKFLTDLKPIKVNAMGNDNVFKNIESVGLIKVEYENNFIVHINVNWLAPIKIRQTFITGSKKMLLFDDVKIIDKIQIYKKGIINNDNPEKIGYRSGSIITPKINNIEPLENALNDFINSIDKNSIPLSNGVIGLETIRILEAVNLSSRNKGMEIKISQKR